MKRGLKLVGGLLLLTSALPRSAAADDPSPKAQAAATTLPSVGKQFTDKELPALESGETVWTKHNHRWCHGLAFHDRWVFASSAETGHILKFERTSGNAELEYKGAIPFERLTTENQSGSWLHVRPLADGAALLYLHYTTHKESSLFCYAVDGKTGTLTLKGRADPKFPNNEVSGGYGYPVLVWSPDQSRLYYVGVKKILWYRFGEDGLPMLDGKGMACTNPGKAGRGRGHALFSPDGRQLYTLIEKMAPNDKVFWQVDSYECNPKTGELTALASLDLPELPQGPNNEFMGFTPGGKLLYLVDEKATCYYALKRDGEKGALSILTSGKPHASIEGAGGPPWTRGGKFAFAADGKTGYYLGTRAFGSFTLDPDSGALSGFSSTTGMWSKLQLDAAKGHIFLAGGTSISFLKSAGPK